MVVFFCERSQLPAEQTLLEGKSSDELGAVRRDQQLLFELYPLGSIHIADITLDTDDHARLQDPLPAELREVLRMRHKRRFAMHAHAVQHGCIAALHEPLRYLPGLLRQLPVADARPDDPDVVLYLVIGMPIQQLLIGCRPAGSAVKRAGEVRVVSEAADGVGIERDQLSRPNAPPAGFTEPRIGTRP